MDGRPGGLGLGLSIRTTTTYSNNNPNSGDPEADTGPIFNGESLENITAKNASGQAQYFSQLFARKKDGKKVGFRKLTTYKNPSHRDTVTKTKREASVYRRLKVLDGWEKHIVPFERSGNANMYSYIDFKYLDGKDLIDYLNNDSPTKQEQYRLLLDIVKGLEFLVEHGFIHNDLKADNIFVKLSGSKPNALLLDFADSKRDPTERELKTEFARLKELVGDFPVGDSLELGDAPETMEDLKSAYEKVAEQCKEKMRGTLGGGRRRKTKKNRKYK